VGCLGGCLVLALVGAAFGLGLAGLIFTGLKTSGPYAQALELARQSHEVVEALGEPIEAGWLASGSVHITGSSGEAELSIPIHGPRNRGTIHVIAEKRAGQWEFELLEVEVEGQSERIDLLSPEPDLREILGPDRA
jgi:hypothetical protein